MTSAEIVIASIAGGILLLAAAVVGVRLGLVNPERGIEKPNVSVLVLGYSGAGKTTFLAALHKHFNYGHADGIRLCTDDQSAILLDQKTESIDESSGSLDQNPTIPGETKLWTFDVKMDSGDGTAAVNLFTLDYLDYPGTFLDDKPGMRNPQFSRAYHNADIMMGMIDGDKLGRLMSPREELLDDGDKRVFIRQIENLLRDLTRHDTGVNHLIISKWDLLQSAGPRRKVADVVEYLEGVSEPFRVFRKDPRNVDMQIIPVAAFGINGFARRNIIQTVLRRIFRMDRDPEKAWKPWNMEVPFFWLIPDVVQHAMKRVDRQEGNLTGITRYLISTLGLELTFQIVVPFLPISITLSPHIRRSAKKIKRNPRPQGVNELKTFFEIANRKIREYRIHAITWWTSAGKDAD